MTFSDIVINPILFCYINDVEQDQKDPKFYEKFVHRLKKLPTVNPKHWEYCLEELKSTAT